MATGVSEPAFGLITTGLSEPARFFIGLRDPFTLTSGTSVLRENSDGIPMAVLGLLGRGFLDDFGVEDEGEVENNFLEDQGLGETDLVLRGAGLGVVKFDTEAAKMQCK